MASFDFSKLSKPLSADEPCGPDLDLAGDPDFSNFVARAEGSFPASFFTRDNDNKLVPFDRATIDFGSEFKALDKLLADTRDLRLLVIYTRLLALNRDLAGFADCLDGIALLLREFWEDVPPKGEGGDYGLRSAVLQALDDNPTVVLPLQYLPLVNTRRSGAISYRSVTVASGEAAARPDEQTFDRGALDRALEEAELDELKATSAQLHKALDAANAIQIVTVDKAGFDQAVSLDKLAALLPKMIAFVDGGVASRDPTSAQALAQSAPGEPAEAGGAAAADASQPVGSAVPAGAVSDLASAGRALSAVLAYFQLFEPSNPAVLLVQQSRAMMGKSFPEVMKLLLPAQVEQAKIQIGADKLFGLTFGQFAEASPTDAGSPAAAAAQADGPDAASITAGTRREAAALLDQISAFYRVAEPSSPIPLFTERARSMIDRDFLTILKDVLPAIVPKT